MRHPTIRALAIRVAVLTGVWALMLGVWALTSRATFWPGDVFRPLMLAFAIEAWVAVLATRPGRRPCRKRRLLGARGNRRGALVLPRVCARGVVAGIGAGGIGVSSRGPRRARPPTASTRT
jgi:hypothetical protein